jgi:DNA-binding helix-hairpin-helix protein with protein kinase domain
MNSSITLINVHGQPIQLGDVIGKGGEGSVYTVVDNENLVAKLYHQRPMPSDTVAKLHAMIARRNNSLEAISAWPAEFVQDPRSREPLGILMPNVRSARQLHDLYGTANRRRHFPEAGWHHMVLAARNVAAAFEAMHSSGIVIGDVNQGNLLVDKSMCVRLIDCDSFQIESEGEIFPCPVGTPHFTPPELQSQKLRDVQRTPDHDRFGLAILIFHLLFVGRHPFAGRFHGAGELTIEKAIAEKRFAFSRDQVATQVSPPPASLQISDLPGSVADLFEWAFRGREGQDNRPTARLWVEQLDALLKQRRPCTFDAAHIYYSKLSDCPWCRIEDEGGPAFFVADGGATMISSSRLNELDRRIQNLQLPDLSDLSPSRLAIPAKRTPKKLSQLPRLSTSDYASAGMVLAAGVALLGINWPMLLAGAGLIAITSGSYLIFNQSCRQRRAEHDNLVKEFATVQAKLIDGARVVSNRHAQRQHKYTESLEDLKTAYEHYLADESKLPDVLAIERATQFNRYLLSHLLQDHVPQISGLNFSMLAILESYGVESALDVDKLKLMGIPNLSPGMTLELMSWRERVAREYKYKPEHGVSFQDARHSADSALKRFKLVQARKVLMGAKQLQGLAEVGTEDLNRDLDKFNHLAEKGKKLATILRDFQSQRRPLERQLNSDPFTTAAIAVAIPLAGLVLHWIFG